MRALRVALALACLVGLVGVLLAEGQLSQAAIDRMQRHRQALLAQSMLAEALVRKLAEEGLAPPLRLVAGELAAGELRWGWEEVTGPITRRTGVRWAVGEPVEGALPVALDGLVVGPAIWAVPPGSWQGPGYGSRLALLTPVAAVVGAVLALDLAGMVWRRRQEQAEARARQELLQRISHELRTPAAGVKSLVETLEAGAAEDPEVVRSFLPVIREEADRLAEGIVRLLRAARRGEGVPMERKEVEIAGWLEGVGQRWGPRLPGLVVEAEPGVALLDRARLDEGVDVLLDNARRYGAAPWRVAARRRGEQVEVVVEDSGPGVPEALRGSLFQQKLGSAGFGLGLWAAAEAARAHGGRLVLEGGVVLCSR